MSEKTASITSPEAGAAVAPADVLVYNRTPTKIAGIYKYVDSKTGKAVELPPGGTALVPAAVADDWCRISMGNVTRSADPSLATSSEALLQIERAKTASLDAKIKEMEARHAELERRLRDRT